MAFVAGPGRQRLPLSGRKLLRWGLVLLLRRSRPADDPAGLDTGH